MDKQKEYLLGKEEQLKRDLLEPERFQYLGRSDSILYKQVKDSDDPKDRKIKELLEDKALGCRYAHVNAIH